MRYLILITLLLSGCDIELTQPPPGVQIGDWICSKEDHTERYMYHHQQYGGIVVVYHNHVFSVDPLLFEKCSNNQ